MSKTTELIELKPLKPFVGTYKCSADDADQIEEELVPNDKGEFVKARIARKKFMGLVSIERAATLAELEDICAGRVPPHLELISAPPAKPDPHVVVYVTAHPPQRTVRVPADIAKSLVDRGLAEIVTGKGARR